MKKVISDFIDHDLEFDKITIAAMVCLMTVFAGIFGYVYEFFFYYFNFGCKQWFLMGGNFLPFINIYAYGSLLIFFLGYKFRKSPLKVFLISFFSTGVLEYIGGWFCLEFLHTRFWDYNTEILNFGNIDGFVCLRSVLVFGLAGLMLMYLVLPIMCYVIRHMDPKKFQKIAFTIFAVFMIDEIYNIVGPNLFGTISARQFYESLGFKYRWK